MDHTLAPQPPEAVDLRQDIPHASRQDHLPRRNLTAINEPQPEVAILTLGTDHLTIFNPDRGVRPKLLPSNPAQLGGIFPVAREEAVRGVTGRIARLATVEQEHVAPGPAKHQGGTQPTWAPANDDDIVLIHLSSPLIDT
jgi:hypothetical protein